MNSIENTQNIQCSRWEWIRVMIIKANPNAHWVAARSNGRRKKDYSLAQHDFSGGRCLTCVVTHGDSSGDSQVFWYFRILLACEIISHARISRWGWALLPLHPLLSLTHCRALTPSPWRTVSLQYPVIHDLPESLNDIHSFFPEPAATLSLLAIISPHKYT